MLARKLLFRAFALLCAAGVAALVAAYPLGWGIAALALGSYALLLLYRPRSWLYVLPALLPLLNLYPWTGWLFFEEFDLAVLVTLAVGYWRANPRRPSIGLAPVGAVTAALLALSYVVAAMVAMSRVEQWEWAALANYNTPLNGLRVLKGFAWPLLLLPLARRSAEDPNWDFRWRFGYGMLGGLALASLVVLWERHAFPGLLNFSSEYRAIGSFYETHVGGAALDGYLALTLPFAALFLLQARTVVQLSLGLLLLGLGSYACFATFSRGLYLGIAVAAVAIAAVIARVARGQNAFRLGALALACIVCVVLLVQVFASGGYRTLAAVLGFYAVCIYLGGREGAIAWKPALAAVVPLGALVGLLALYVPKGAYLAYGIVFCLFAVLAALELLGRPRRGAALALGACTGLGAIAVGWHWGGAEAMQDAIVAVAVAGALALYNRTPSGGLWTLDLRTASSFLAAGLVVAIAIPISGNYYMQARVKEVRQDLSERESHWDASLDLLDTELSTLLFGAGLGRYPELYYWNNRKGEFPGVSVFMREDGRNFMRIGGARNAPDLIRLSQRITLEPRQTLIVEATLRGATGKPLLYIDLCEKWLLYTERCTGKPVVLRPAGNEWLEVSQPIYSGALGTASWVRMRPTIVYMAVDSNAAAVDIDSVRIFDRSGRNLLANGDFASSERWFFTSDRSHLPWHAKNLWLGVWFDQGALGLAAFLAFSAVALFMSFRTPSSAGIWQATGPALIAFFVVGLFDTLLDATRLAAIFYLLCLLAMLQPRSLLPANSPAGRVRSSRSGSRSRSRHGARTRLASASIVFSESRDALKPFSVSSNNRDI